MLLAADLPLPKHVFVHGYLLLDGEKMSKSLGNVLDPFAAIDRFGSDALRYYCFRDVSFGQDGSVSTTQFEQRYESELANELGNLASRTTNMLVRYRDGAVPDASSSPGIAAVFGRDRRRGSRTARQGGESPLRWRSSGAGSVRSTGTSPRRRRGSSPRTTRRPLSWTSHWPPSPRDCA